MKRAIAYVREQVRQMLHPASKSATPHHGAQGAQIGVYSIQ